MKNITKTILLVLGFTVSASANVNNVVKNDKLKEKTEEMMSLIFDEEVKEIIHEEKTKEEEKVEKEYFDGMKQNQNLETNYYLVKLKNYVDNPSKKDNNLNYDEKDLIKELYAKFEKTGRIGNIDRLRIDLMYAKQFWEDVNLGKHFSYNF